ncbi:SdrD B-like domain-containing protein [Acinetobacter venetianus]|uniref:SdrD B-like domain-containing protein n=1 Tax=Acinetobacter venetianus TaxID=52133 RepID=UPI0035BE43C5
MLQQKQIRACQNMSFMLSTLTISILSAQYGHAANIPEVGSTIQNVAYATFTAANGKEQQSVSNTVEVSVSALYAITLTTPPVLDVEPSVKVIWANTLSNNSNAPVNVQLEALTINQLNNIKIYIDSNKDGQFDTNDPQLTTNVPLQIGQSVNLWVVATTSSDLTEGQQFNLPIKATVLEDSNVTATATDSAISYGAKLIATKEVQQKTFEPSAAANYDLNYTLNIANQGKKPAKPIDVMVDGQIQKMVLLVDDLPPNTTFKSALVKNAQAKILYKLANNSYSTIAPNDLTLINQLVVGFPQIAANTTEQVDLVVSMNRNIAKTTVKNTYKVSYAVTDSQKDVLSNIASTLVSGSADITNNSSDFKSILATGSVNKPLNIEAKNASCNADRYSADRVKIRIKSTKTGDLEEVIGVETGANTGVFHYTLPTTLSDKGIPFDAVLQTLKRDNVDISLTDCLDSKGQSTETITDINTNVLMDPYGTVFDAKTGLPVAGATITLLDQNGQPIGDNVAFEIDSQTGNQISIPATQVTNSAGEFIYPLVKAGTYSFTVDTKTIPGNTRYTFVSDRSVYPSFSADKAVDLRWSYAGQFTLNNGDPALNIDIPIDPEVASTNSSLFVKKAASNKTAEIGEFEEYTVTVANRGTADSTNVSITDTLPRGFIYVQGSMRVDGTKVEDPLGGKGPYLKLGLGTLAPDKEVKVQYRVYIGPNALNGDGINRVRAKDSKGIESNEASAKVEVTPGAMISDGFIVGKIFTDCNRNGIQDSGEIGVPGVRIYLEDGSYVITDSEGKYDFYGISAKTHVLKVDRTSLPIGSELVLISNRQAGDPNSRFVDLKRGELHRADFAIAEGVGQCSESLIERVLERKKRIEQDNTNLEQVLRSDLTVDPIFSKVTDVRGQPSSGCISVVGIQANCNLDFSKEQIKEIKQIQFEPEKSGAQPSVALPSSSTLALPNEEALDSTNATKMINLETALETAVNNQLEILNLKDGQVLPYPQTSIQVKGAAGTQLELWVNGARIPEKRIGKRAVLPNMQVSGLDFIGVDLNAGRNTIEVRQVDMMGNIRDIKRIDVIAPDQLDKLQLEPSKNIPQANGRDRFNVNLKIVDRHGTLVSSRTPITLDSSIGKIDLVDLDSKQPGIQVFVEGGTLLVPIQAPIEAGEGTLSVESGIFHSSTPIRFLPDLRPIIAVGMVEGSFNFKKFDPKALSGINSNDGFEEELNEISSSKDGKRNLTGRAALFLKGKVKGEYLLTLAYDSDKDKNQRLFRDIRPDEYYPVYGDSAAKGFDAQSTSKLYVRVDKGRSYAMYGDYVTRTENDEGLSLGQYNRSLTGIRSTVEIDKYKVTAFAAQTNTQQVVNEQRAMGISGPYSLGGVNAQDIRDNSEKVEVITRDRNNPGLIIARTTLTRFTDYEVDTFSNSIYLKDPVPSVDADLNPVFLRITVESDQGGDEYTVGGVSGSVKVTDKVKLGASYVKSNNPLTQDQLASVNTVVKFANDKGKLVAEFARSENINDGLNSLTQVNVEPDATGKLSGDAARVELNYAYKDLEMKVYHNQADTGFYNTAAPITAGRKESGIKGRVQLNKIGLAKLEAIRTEDQLSGVNQGISASIERAINRILAVELGLKYYDESSNPATLNTTQIAPYHGVTVRSKLTSQLPWQGSNVFAEYEQDISEADRRIFAVGANYQINSKLRAYGRHEVVSSINGLYDLNSNQRRNVTVFGLDSKYNNNGTAFSEYRVRDGISAREAEAAIGLRNRWELEKGFYANTSFEQTKSLSNSNNLSSDSTAASLGVEYLKNPNWKTVARIEARWSDQSDTILNNLGAAYKYSDDVTLLAKNVVSLTDSKNESSGDRLVDRFQLGLAYRDTEHNRFDALAKVEYRYDDNKTDLSNPYLKHVYIFSNHLNYHPTRDLTLSGQYAVKNVQTTFSGLESTGMTHLFSARAMYDINERWDAGVHTGLLWSDMSSGRRVLVGGEVGYLVAANLWLSGGYNFSGYKDDDLVDSDTTIQGAYLRFRFKFDESLFSRNDSSFNASREP